MKITLKNVELGYAQVYANGKRVGTVMRQDFSPRFWQAYDNTRRRVAPARYTRASAVRDLAE